MCFEKVGFVLCINAYWILSSGHCRERFLSTDWCKNNQKLEAGCILAYQILSPGEVPLDFISCWVLVDLILEILREHGQLGGEQQSLRIEYWA
jgi:hypothetical protein